MASSDQPVVKSSEPFAWFKNFPREVRNKIYQQVWTNTGPVKFLLKGSHGVAVVSYNVQEPTKDLPSDAVFLPTWLRTSRVFMEEALNELYLYSSCLVNTHIYHRDISHGNLLDLSHFHDLQLIADVTYWEQYNYRGVLARRILDLMRLNHVLNRIQNLELWLFTESDDYVGLAAVKRVLLLLNLYSRLSKDRCSELKSLTINIQYDRGHVSPHSLIMPTRLVFEEWFTEQSCHVNRPAPPNPSDFWTVCMKFEPKEG